jgi:hypothetical protein
VFFSRYGYTQSSQPASQSSGYSQGVAIPTSHLTQSSQPMTASLSQVSTHIEKKCKNPNLVKVLTNLVIYRIPRSLEILNRKSHSKIDLRSILHHNSLKAVSIPFQNQCEWLNKNRHSRTCKPSGPKPRCVCCKYASHLRDVLHKVKGIKLLKRKFLSIIKSKY